uniref:Uncharacterized protein n=1 Tax=Glossina austeni TaxID=7395 RepID=A0A1A9VCP6_GLOAU
MLGGEGAAAKVAAATEAREDGLALRTVSNSGPAPNGSRTKQKWSIVKSPSSKGTMSLRALNFFPAGDMKYTSALSLLASRFARHTNSRFQPFSSCKDVVTNLRLTPFPVVVFTVSTSSSSSISEPETSNLNGVFVIFEKFSSSSSSGGSSTLCSASPSVLRQKSKSNIKKCCLRLLRIRPKRISLMFVVFGYVYYLFTAFHLNLLEYFFAVSYRSLKFANCVNTNDSHKE